MIILCEYTVRGSPGAIRFRPMTGPGRSVFQQGYTVAVQPRSSPARLQPHERAEIGNKPVVSGIAINAALAAGKIAGGIFGSSFALIADGLESFADIFSSIIVYVGLR